jgi:hypothetical protein
MQTNDCNLITAAPTWEICLEKLLLPSLPRIGLFKSVRTAAAWAIWLRCLNYGRAQLCLLLLLLPLPLGKKILYRWCIKSEFVTAQASGLPCQTAMSFQFFRWMNFVLSFVFYDGDERCEISVIAFLYTLESLEVKKSMFCALTRGPSNSYRAEFVGPLAVCDFVHAVAQHSLRGITLFSFYLIVILNFVCATCTLLLAILV